MLCTASDILCQALRRHGLTDDQVNQAIEGWEIIPCEQDGQTVGACAIKGTEVHFEMTPAFKLRRKQMREFLAPLHERFGFLTTRVAIEDTANQRFNALFGFERTWSDGTFHYYLMANLPFGKE